MIRQVWEWSGKYVTNILCNGLWVPCFLSLSLPLSPSLPLSFSLPLYTSPALSLSSDGPHAHQQMTALTVHLPFVGFTFTNCSSLSDNPPTSRGGKGSPQDSVNSGHLRTENSRLQAEVEELKKQVASAGVLKPDCKCYLVAGYLSLMACHWCIMPRGRFRSLCLCR